MTLSVRALCLLGLSGLVAGVVSARQGRPELSPPAGPLMVIHVNPSALGTLTLDGKGGYKTARSQGRYSVDAA